MQLGIPLRWMALLPQERICCQRILESSSGGWVARHFNKRLSLPVSIFLARRGITPNQITAFNLILGLVSGFVAALGGYVNLVMGAILFQMVSIIDGCDGEVAKLNHCETRFGAWFDTLGDNLSFVVFIVGVAFGIYRESPSAWIVRAAQVSLLSFAVLLSIMIHYLLQRKNQSASLITYEKEIINQSVKDRKALWARAMDRGKFLIKKDFFAFLFLILALCNLAEGIVFFAALGTTAVAIVLSVITIRKRPSQLVSLGESASEAIH